MTTKETQQLIEKWQRENGKASWELPSEPELAAFVDREFQRAFAEPTTAQSTSASTHAEPNFPWNLTLPPEARVLTQPPEVSGDIWGDFDPLPATDPVFSAPTYEELAVEVIDLTTPPAAPIYCYEASEVPTAPARGNLGLFSPPISDPGSIADLGAFPLDDAQFTFKLSEVVIRPDIMIPEIEKPVAGPYAAATANPVLHNRNNKRKLDTTLAPSFTDLNTPSGNAKQPRKK